MPEIAIVDDEKILVDSLAIALKTKGYLIRPFYEGAPFLDYIQSHEPDLVFLDLRLPDIHGLEVLGKIKEVNEAIITIIITAHGDMESAIKALKSGAADFINKPFDLDEIILLIGKLLHEKKLRTEVEHRRERSYRSESLDSFLGESKPIRDLLHKVRMVAGSGVTTVLIRGESGVGKEILAKAIHNLSPFSENQFIDINCASLPENLLESELFGHEKGAFTDAKKRKTGLAELADGGTLFLDEVGELTPPIQAKLLRFLENKTFRRIGGSTEITVRAMIVTATNRDLEQAVTAGEFRSDLYYRLNVVPLVIPPLRARGRDVLLIAEHYLDRLSKKFGKARPILDREAEKILLSYDWPGNVRELRNLMEMLVIMNPGEEITSDQLPAKLLSRGLGLAPVTVDPIDSALSLTDKVRIFESRLIKEALARTSGVKADAARLLGISRYALLRKIRSLEIGE